MANGNFGGGTGSQSSPYIVEDIYDLNEIRNNSSGSYYIQSENIDATSIGNFTPISCDSVNYNGSGYEISNLTIISENTSGYTGLFSNLTDGYVSNLQLINCNISGVENVGSIVGHINGQLEILNCSSSGSVSGSRYVGGLVGSTESWGNIHIRNCYSSCDVSGSNVVGGLVGYALRHVSGIVVVDKSYSSGVVSGSSTVGGLVGACSGRTSIHHCFALNPKIVNIGGGNGKFSRICASINVSDLTFYPFYNYARSDMLYEVL